MPPKTGLLGTLSVIALGVGLGGSQGHADVVDVERLCRLIESMPNAEAFQAIPAVMDALKDPFNSCHGVALGKWASFDAKPPSDTGSGPPTSTGSIGGYGFQ